MRPLLYSINVTLDGCVDHTAGIPSVAVHQHAVENFSRVDALLFGRTTYELMEAGWREPNPMRPEWMEPFAQSISSMKKYVVSKTLQRIDWNSERVTGDLRTAVQALKDQPGKGLATGGVTLPKALAELGLIDEYEVVVHPRIAGRGPALFAGLSTFLDLELVSEKQIGDGTVSLRYFPRGRKD